MLLAEKKQFFVSYTAVGATLEHLNSIKDDYEPANSYYVLLGERLNNHMYFVEQTCHSAVATEAEDMEGGRIKI